jgi:hypothetical protein
MTPTPESQLPPSIAFVSFRSAIQNLRDYGLPETLDRTAWKTRSGTEQTQIVSSLKFFGLTDDKGNTQPSLKELTATQENTDAEKACWEKLLRQNYEPVFTVDLANATPKQLDDAIASYGVTGLAKKRTVRFFLKAALHAKIQLSSRLTADLRDRSTPVGGNGSTEGASTETNEQKTQSKRRPKKRQPGSSNPNANPGRNDGVVAMKTIQLPKVNGSLSISGTFNPLQLMGDERELVYKIVDLMSAYEEKSPE